MRHPRRHLAVALAFGLSLSACSDGPAAPEPLTLFDCESGVSYVVGRTVNGAIDADDCLDPFGESFADYYGLTLAANGPLSVTVRANQNQDALVVILVRNEDELVDFALVEPGSYRSIGGDLTAGNYVIIIAGNEAGHTGNYSVRSARELPPVYDCDQIAPLAIGVTVNATISATDCLEPAGSRFADYHEITHAAEGPLSVLVVPGGQRPLLVGLTYADGSFILFTQMTRDGATPVGSIHLPAGRYTVIVAASEAGETASYSIRASTASPPMPSLNPFLDCMTGQPYTIGTTAPGAMASTDCASQVGRLIDRFDFSLTTARKVTIDMESASLDPFLYLFDGAGTLLAFDDDAGADYNARIEITLPAGSYAIGASAYFTDGSGPYTLSSSSVAAGSVIQARVVPSQSRIEAEPLASAPKASLAQRVGMHRAGSRFPVDRLHQKVAPTAP